MAVITKISNLQKYLDATRKAGRKIGFVPTMGALHEGHLTLIRQCRREGMFCVVSIFVNPAQFGPEEDFRRYPRRLKEDAKAAEKSGAGLIFAPSVAQMYPDGYRTFAEVEKLPEKLCGKYRPGHFRGVTTVILKFFNQIQPDKAYFGWKDAQQLLVIKKMTADLNLPIEIVGVPTVREADGLAMSSRNAYLSPAERKTAPLLYQTILQIKKSVETREESLKEALRKAKSGLKKNPLIKLQYLEAVDLNNLEDAQSRPFPGQVLVAIAAFLGATRLIDNIIIHAGNRHISEKSV